MRLSQLGQGLPQAPETNKLCGLVQFVTTAANLGRQLQITVLLCPTEARSLPIRRLSI